ncbi:hypothetical protein [Polaromonas sp. CG9_12]|nr:hypothetical protein [Polaromonas sp. CG9_12]
MNIDDLVHLARIELPGVMDAIVVQAIAATAGDFCTRAQVWDELQDPVALVDGVGSYDVDAPSDARVLAVLGAWTPSNELVPVTLARLAYLMPDWQTRQGSVPLYFNAARELGSITVYPRPANALGTLLTLKVRYAPKRTATTLPDFLADKYEDALLHGAKARLMGQVNVPWSAPSVGLIHSQAYEAALAQATVDQLHEYVQSTLRVRPPRFG